MDVESKQTIDEAVDRAKAAADEAVDRAAAKFQAAGAALLNQAEDAIHDALDRVSAEIDHTIGSLDGWTVTITIPSITLRLNAPSKH